MSRSITRSDSVAVKAICIEETLLQVFRAGDRFARLKARKECEGNGFHQPKQTTQETPTGRKAPSMAGGDRLERQTGDVEGGGNRFERRTGDVEGGGDRFEKPAGGAEPARRRVHSRSRNQRRMSPEPIVVGSRIWCSDTVLGRQEAAPRARPMPTLRYAFSAAMRFSSVATAALPRRPSATPMVSA